MSNEASLRNCKYDDDDGTLCAAGYWEVKYNPLAFKNVSGFVFITY